MEKGYRDFGHDIDNTDNVIEAGLGFAVDLDKPSFVGREAVAAIKAAGIPHRRLVQVRLTDPDPMLHHGELVMRDGEVVGYVRAASYGWTARRRRRAGDARRRLGAADRRLDQGRHVDGRRRGHGVRRSRLAAADVRPDATNGSRPDAESRAIGWPAAASTERPHLSVRNADGCVLLCSASHM